MLLIHSHARAQNIFQPSIYYGLRNKKKLNTRKDANKGPGNSAFWLCFAHSKNAFRDMHQMSTAAIHAVDEILILLTDISAVHVCGCETGISGRPKSPS